MSDYVSIANLAVGFLGEDDQLTAPDDDTHVSRTVKAAWDLTRQAVIRDHSWNFAMRRGALAALADAAPYPWANAFELPADCLRLIELFDCGEGDWTLEGRSILSQRSGPLYARWLIDVIEPALWDALFTDAFARRLAWQIADRITGDRSRKLDAWNAYQASLTKAIGADARENPRIDNDASTPWEEARAGGWGGHHDGWRNWGPYATS